MAWIRKGRRCYATMENELVPRLVYSNYLGTSAFGHASDMLQPSTSPDVNPTAKTPLFQSSTQYRNWRFSVEQLKSTRASLNQAAIAAIRNTFESDSVCRCPLSWHSFFPSFEAHEAINPLDENDETHLISISSLVRLQMSIFSTPTRSTSSLSCISPKFLNCVAIFASRRR
jgi:hypothetical protein